MLSALVGLGAAVINSGMVSLSSPHLRLHNLQIAAATAYVDVDPPVTMPSLVAWERSGRRSTSRRIVKRAELLGRIMVSQPVLDRIAPRCGCPAQTAFGARPDNRERPFHVLRAVQRAARQRHRGVAGALPTGGRGETHGSRSSTSMRRRHRLRRRSAWRTTRPLALADYLKSLASQQGSTQPIVHLQPLGPARGGVVNARATPEIALLTFLTFFGLSFAALVSGGSAPSPAAGTDSPIRATESLAFAEPEPRRSLSGAAWRARTDRAIAGHTRRGCFPGCSHSSSRSCGSPRSTTSR